MNYLCSFKPLIRTKHGLQAIQTFSLPPYIDGSCRREPDFTSPFPSITALCRSTKFAPRLREEDRVAYITVQGWYPPLVRGHWRLIAILKILKRFATHQEAADWYTTRGTPLPGNCMVDGNPPLPLEKTAGLPSSFQAMRSPEVGHRAWDAAYRTRARDCGVFLACAPEFLELWEPPVLTREVMARIFGRIPGTQNPPRISDEELAGLREWAQRSGQDGG